MERIRASLIWWLRSARYKHVWAQNKCIVFIWDMYVPYVGIFNTGAQVGARHAQYLKDNYDQFWIDTLKYQRL